ncbi:DNA polymerase IV [Rhizosaccharibacter radicis]|uniref:DNA polymerase IV n=1 Tax=Rhizosaccharibacter radicis TaxID=2782605 RepID=A0ABT1VWM1_9PROT|nr:DNA polymerase IV [Acetobacteraceae bacterium KSS12]
MRHRRIIHVDMDAFYASVEQRDDPSLQGRPVAVGGSRERGVVAAASYEARRFGVRSAMPSVTARRLCPELLFVRPRFEVYRGVSQQIRAIFADYTSLIQPLALDEAYLDVTEPLRDLGSATAIATEIRARIRAETGLTASAGVSYNKFLAKLASDHRKPDGLFVVTPRMGPDFVLDLPVSRFHGVGPVTARKMERLGIHSGRDLRDRSAEFLSQHFGKAGPHYHAISRGEDERAVVVDRPRKSIGAEQTFERDLDTLPDLMAALDAPIAKVWAAYERGGRGARTVTLKVKFSDFRLMTRAASFPRAVRTREAFREAAMTLLRAQHPFPLSVRLLGVSLSRYEDEAEGTLAPGTDLFTSLLAAPDGIASAG